MDPLLLVSCSIARYQEKNISSYLSLENEIEQKHRTGEISEFYCYIKFYVILCHLENTKWMKTSQFYPLYYPLYYQRKTLCKLSCFFFFVYVLLWCHQPFFFWKCRLLNEMEVKSAKVTCWWVTLIKWGWLYLNSILKFKIGRFLYFRYKYPHTMIIMLTKGHGRKCLYWIKYI